jgi:NADP-dependent 3-hydroxy acid dehydrogenase YdfG
MNSKVIVVTGATGGVGSDIVKSFVSKNWNVVGLSRDQNKLDTLALTLNSELFYGVLTDVGDYRSIKQAFATVARRFNGIDVLVNNASIFKTKNFKEFDVQDINDIVDTNLKGTMFCTLECLKLMKRGRIINVCSVSGLHGIENQAVYSASKHAIIGFSDSLNQETIRLGIKISTICPGGINTPLWNDGNPYNGDVTKLLTPHDITTMVDYIVNLPDNCVLKNVTIFPECEWH